MRFLASALLVLGMIGPPQGGAAFGQTLGDLARPAAQAQKPGLLGAIEFETRSKKALPQWRKIMDWFERNGPAYDGCLADAGRCPTAHHQSWRRVVEAARGLDDRGKLDAVNRFFNGWPYRLDRDVYGVDDFWANPDEFMKNSGDCEDYAIAKFFTLTRLGVAQDRMRVVAVMDEIRGIGHAVLAVWMPREILLLDNLSEVILPDRMYTHYRPVYSANLTTIWTHIPASAGSGR